MMCEEKFQHLDVGAQFKTTFPKSITLNQTIAVWKHIVLYQKQEEHN